MQVLVLGNGGREHALAWKIAQSPMAHAVFADATVCAAEPDLKQAPVFADVAACAAFCLEVGIDLVVVGPEAPLVAGWADALRADGFRVFGPGAAGARLEGSKIFAKEFMQRHGLPTAGFSVCTSMEEVQAALGSFSCLPVVKYDGLAAGKGVGVPESAEEALAFARDGFERGKQLKLLLEERLTGPEVSLLAITDGHDVQLLPPCQDHKRLLEGDGGPNTGGMGAYTPVPGTGDSWQSQMRKIVFEPFLAGLAADGIDYRGVIYAGLMLTESGPKVLEFNCRFGDPETQPLMCAIGEDILPLLFSAAVGKLARRELDACASMCVVLAAAGYPVSPKSGDEITGLQRAAEISGVKVFHAGTKCVDGRFFTRGGRVLGVTGVGADLKQAAAAAYEAVGHIQFPGMQVRRDIGYKALE